MALEDWARLRINLVRLYRGTPASRAGHFSSSHMVVWRINRGRASGQTEHGPFVARAGQWLLHLPARRFQSFQPGSEIDSVQLQVRWPSGARALEGPTPLLLADREIGKLRVEFDALLAWSRTEPERRTLAPSATFNLPEAMQIQASLMKWCGQLLTAALTQGWHFRQERDLDGRLQKLTAYLNRHALDQPLNQEDWAQTSALGAARLSRFFHAHYGMTPRRYFEERRIDYARAALETNELSVKEIASELGFTNLQRFSTWFKTLEGVAPRTFRRVCFPNA